jgi:hypothetical protein
MNNPTRSYAPRGVFLARYLDLEAQLRAGIEAQDRDAMTFIERWSRFGPTEKQAKAIDILQPRFIGSDLITHTAFMTTAEATRILAKYRGEVASVVDTYVDANGEANFTVLGVAGAMAVLVLLCSKMRRNRHLYGRVFRFCGMLDGLRWQRMKLVPDVISWLDQAAADRRTSKLIPHIASVPPGLLIPVTAATNLDKAN